MGDKKMTFEDVLNEQGYFVFTNVGTSMLPLLRQGKDLVVILKRGSDRMKKYDAVLFRRDNGQYILHRVLKVREKDYLIAGDNCTWSEAVDDAHIIGVLNAVVRDGRQIPVTDLRYRAYVHLWCDLYPLRMLILRAYPALRRRAGRLVRKLKSPKG